MTKRTFLMELEDILEAKTGSLAGSESLADLEGWDSLAVMAFIAMVDEKLGVALSASKLAAAKTVADLVALLGDRIAG